MLGFKILTVKIKQISNENHFVSFSLEGRSLKGLMISNGEFSRSLFFEANPHYSLQIEIPLNYNNNQIIEN